MKQGLSIVNGKHTSYPELVVKLKKENSDVTWVKANYFEAYIVFWTKSHGKNTVEFHHAYLCK